MAFGLLTLVEVLSLRFEEVVSLQHNLACVVCPFG